MHDGPWHLDKVVLITLLRWGPGKLVRSGLSTAFRAIPSAPVTLSLPDVYHLLHKFVW